MSIHDISVDPTDADTDGVEIKDVDRITARFSWIESFGCIRRQRRKGPRVAFPLKSGD
jgi:hypothetical protein